jgi:hypothetical protein
MDDWRVSVSASANVSVSVSVSVYVCEGAAWPSHESVRV